jgi:hypothetical protein
MDEKIESIECSLEAKDRRRERTSVRKFMKGLPERKQVISSTDGLLSVPRTPKIARKPG